MPKQKKFKQKFITEQKMWWKISLCLSVVLFFCLFLFLSVCLSPSLPYSFFSLSLYYKLTFLNELFLRNAFLFFSLSVFVSLSLSFSLSLPLYLSLYYKHTFLNELFFWNTFIFFKKFDQKLTPSTGHSSDACFRRTEKKMIKNYKLQVYKFTSYKFTSYKFTN